MAKDIALDNLWNTTDVTALYTTTGSPVKMVKKSGKAIDSKNKVQGYMIYFLSKDKKCKQFGKPQKFLRVQRMGKTTNDYIPANLVVPHYEDVVKNKNYWISIGGRDVVAKAESRLAGEGMLASRFSGVNAQDFGINSDLLDTGSLLNVDNNNYSNVGGAALKEVSDPNTAIVDAQTMNKAYAESGSRTPFRDWISTDGGRGVVNEFTKLVNALVNKPQDGLHFGDDGNKDPNDDNNKPPIKTETKILGMSPILFGVVAFGVIAIGSIIAIKMINSKQKLAGA